MLVLNVVRELQFVERDGLLHPLLAGCGRIWVNVEPTVGVRIGFACYCPLVVVILVAVVISRVNIHRHHVLGLGVKALHLHLEWREHAPGRKCRAF